MTIKSLLIGSAAAIVAASGAQAADAIVAADPEPVEYVQVCDTYGDGYFYIPGTETCLKFSGYVQWQSVFDNDEADGIALNIDETAFLANASAADIAAATAANGGTPLDGAAVEAEHSYEARLLVEAKNDSEIGTISSAIRLTASGDGADAFDVDRAYMTIGDGNVWTVGLAGNPWDFSIVGEQNYIRGGSARLMVGYTAAFDGGTIGLYAIDDTDADNESPDFVGKATFTAGDVGVVAALSYDESLSAGEFGAKVNLTYMGFGFHAQYSEDSSYGDYNTGYEWVYGVGYGFDATDKLNIQLAADYAVDAAAGLHGGVFTQAGDDNYALSVNATYQIADGLAAALRFTHMGGDSFDDAASFEKEHNQVRFRLTRSF